MEPHCNQWPSGRQFWMRVNDFPEAEDTIVWTKMKGWYLVVSICWFASILEIGASILAHTAKDLFRSHAVSLHGCGVERRSLQKGFCQQVFSGLGTSEESTFPRIPSGKSRPGSAGEWDLNLGVFQSFQVKAESFSIHKTADPWYHGQKGMRKALPKRAQAALWFQCGAAVSLDSFLGPLLSKEMQSTTYLTASVRSLSATQFLGQYKLKSLSDQDAI